MHVRKPSAVWPLQTVRRGGYPSVQFHCFDETVSHGVVTVHTWRWHCVNHRSSSNYGELELKILRSASIFHQVATRNRIMENPANRYRPGGAGRWGNEWVLLVRRGGGQSTDASSSSREYRVLFWCGLYPITHANGGKTFTFPSHISSYFFTIGNEARSIK